MPLETNDENRTQQTSAIHYPLLEEGLKLNFFSYLL